MSVQTKADVPTNVVSVDDDEENVPNENAASSHSSTTESESMSYSQQFQETNVSIPLPDGYECTVQLDRCSVDTASNAPRLASETDVIIPLPDGYECTVQLDRCSVDTASDAPVLTSGMDVERQLRELREEEEKATYQSSHDTPVSYIGVPEGEDPEYYFETLPLEDFNFLETYNNIDMPRPSPPKDDNN